MAKVVVKPGGEEADRAVCLLNINALATHCRPEVVVLPICFGIAKHTLAGSSAHRPQRPSRAVKIVNDKLSNIYLDGEVVKIALTS